MTRTLRAIGSTVLWAVAVIGAVCVLVWGTTALGLIKPLIVISGSMEPGIMTGDLLIDTPRDTADAKVGEVASLYSDVTGNDVTHRIVAIDEVSDGTWQIRLKGDANDSEDGGPYTEDATIWQPALQLPGMGYAIVTITKPSVALPLAITLIACLGISLMPRAKRKNENPSDGDNDDAAVAAEDTDTNADALAEPAAELADASGR